MPRPLIPPLALALLILASPLALAQDAAVLMQAKAAAKLRQERSTESAVVGRLEPGQRVKAGFAANNWLAVFPPDSPGDDESARQGYVYAPLLEPAGAVSERPAAAAPQPIPPATAPHPGPAASGPAAPYTVLAKQTADRTAGPLLECAVMVSTASLPSPDDLKTLAARVRAEQATTEPRMAVYLYVPGQSLDGPSYAVARFDADGLVEFWTRDTVLYGTPWAAQIR
jgi:hypothetical protein